MNYYPLADSPGGKKGTTSNTILKSERATFHVVLLFGAGCTAGVDLSRKFESAKKILNVNAKFECLFMHLLYEV
jgi:hypothetical protein